MMELKSPLRKHNLSRCEASDYLRETYGIPCAPATLAKMVTTGGGPRYHKVNRSPLYPVAELDAWARKQLGPRTRHRPIPPTRGARMAAPAPEAETMARGPCNFRQRVLTRVLRATVDAKIAVRRIEIREGTVVVVTGDAPAAPADDLDRELEEFIEARHGQN